MKALTRFWWLLGALLVWAVPARAQISYSVEPMVTEFAAKSGGQATEILTITHEIGKDAKKEDVAPLRLRFYAVDWTLSRAGTPTFGKPGSIKGCCSDWVQISPLELTVPAGERREVRYTLRVPDGVSGNFRTMIMAETVTQPGKAAGRTVRINGRIGSAVYVQVGPQSRRARVSGMAVSPEKAVITIENTGNSHVRLTGTLEFRDDSGKMVKQAPFTGGVVLCGENNVRDVAVEMPQLPGGKYQVTAILDYGGEVLLGARAQVTIP